MGNYGTGRNARVALEKIDCDPRLKVMIAELYEKDKAIEKQLVEVASLLGMVINQAEAFNMIAENVKSKIEGFERNTRQLQDEDKQ